MAHKDVSTATARRVAHIIHNLFAEAKPNRVKREIVLSDDPEDIGGILIRVDGKVVCHVRSDGSTHAMCDITFSGHIE